jgi:divalent metal cation (Fe/Co/Zn/Cd) transporter
MRVACDPTRVAGCWNAFAQTILILLGYPLGDPIAAILVATIIAVNALILFRDSTSFLLGKSPGSTFLAELEQAARSVPGVIEVRGYALNSSAPIRCTRACASM